MKVPCWITMQNFESQVQAFLSGYPKPGRFVWELAEKLDKFLRVFSADMMYAYVNYHFWKPILDQAIKEDQKEWKERKKAKTKSQTCRKNIR